MIWNKLFGGNKSENTDVPKVSVSSDTLVVTPTESTDDSDNLIIEEKLFQFDDEIDIPLPHLNNSSLIGKEKSRLVKFLDGLKKSRNQLTGALGGIFTGNAVSAQMLDDLEDILLASDLGTQTAALLRQDVEKEKFGKDTTEAEIKVFLCQKIENLLRSSEQKLTLRRKARLNVLLFVGVNGSGKTTTIGKFAKHFKQSGLNVMLAAGDTFRAAAVEQLTIWGHRNDVPVFSKPQGSDAAGLVFDAYQHATDNNSDILLIDTAGRLQNKHNLMQELLKIVRVLKKYDDSLPHEIIMVLDATTGQNALNQAEIFRDMADITGIIMTKLDGSAKGGVLVSVAHKMKLPVYAVGIGENLEDLKPFVASDFAKGLIGMD